jgi:hypothetical protein
MSARAHSFFVISSAIIGSAGQPTNVGSTVTATCVASISTCSISPRSTIEIGISGSGIVARSARMSAWEGMWGASSG